jgi:hypothetical protein
MVIRLIGEALNFQDSETKRYVFIAKDDVQR